MSVCKIAEDAGRVEALRQLAMPGMLGKLEAAIVPRKAPAQVDQAAVDAQVAQEQKRIRDLFGVKPHLMGSMRTGLNIPGDVDIDFMVPIKSRAKFDSVLEQLQRQGTYVPSAYNKPGTGHHVFTAPAEATGGYPVDFAVSHGPLAQNYLRDFNRVVDNAHALPDDVRQAIIERKRVLRNTPFDIKQHRYKTFKRQVDRALADGELVPMKREKLARVLNPEDPRDKAYLDRFLTGDDLYGHRTTNAESVLNTGRVMSGLEALHRGHLKDYESGFLPGLRSKFEIPDLDADQLRRVQAATLRPEGADATELGNIAATVGTDPLALKGALIKHRLPEVNKFLGGLGDKAEDWRLSHLRIPKLSPNVFMTHGGLVNDRGYGDVGFLVHTDKAQESPYITMVNHEAIVAPKQGLKMQSVPVRKGLVVAPAERIQALHEAHPEYTFIDEAALPEQHRLSAISVGELGRRVLPHVADGTARVRQG